jgi:glycosyltransferase involved in cell wall biosynthesis
VGCLNVKVLLVSTFITGGAGGAAYQLHKSLQGIGVSSKILVQKKPLGLDDKGVIVARALVKSKLVKGFNIFLRWRLEEFPLKVYPKRHIQTCSFDLFSPQWLPDSIPTLQTVARFCPDLVNLHWICAGGVRIESLPKLRRPLVWTLHDMWPFTGGCHQSLFCSRYTEACGVCPQLHSGKSGDLSRWVWKRKAKAWKHLDLAIVSPSSWLAKCARRSSLFKDLRIEVIPTGIDTRMFKPINRRIAREFFNLPQDKLIILFGAWENTTNKGFHRLWQALQSLVNSDLKDKVELVVFGFSQPINQPDLSFHHYYLGRLKHDIMPMVYSAANVFVAPSRSETFALTVLESLACGTPVVAFDTTGPKEVITHKRNGYLAKPYEVEDLARGITWVLEDGKRHQNLSCHAREKIEQEFTLESMVNRYRTLFNEIVDRSD